MTIWQNVDGTLHDDMDGAALLLPSWPSGMTALTNDQAAALQAPTAAQIIASTKLLAQSTLDEADKTVSRVTQAVALGKTTWNAADVMAWMNWMAEVRAIVSTGSGPIPTKPAYPSGT